VAKTSAKGISQSILHLQTAMWLKAQSHSHGKRDERAIEKKIA